MAEKFKIVNGMAVRDDGQFVNISCLTCVHFFGAPACKAYPNGIPMSIVSGEQLHTVGMWNDNGITYEPKFPETQ